MKKYLQVASLEWLNAFAYRGDTWLTAFFLVFKVLLAYMLWKAVFGGQSTFGGMTLPEMVTYYLLANVIATLTKSDGLLQDFSREIGNGQYAKYIVRPVSPLVYFISASIARSILPALAGVTVLGASMLLFRSYFVALNAANAVWAVVVGILAMILNTLIGYMVSAMAFRFVDIGGFYIIKHIVKEFLSGALIPLNLVFGSAVPAWSPFSYMVYYPVILAMGKSDILPQTVVFILSAWIIVMLIVCLWLQKSAPKAFEGVGM
jgi:ABC-2 type transport system permease protein